MGLPLTTVGSTSQYEAFSENYELQSQIAEGIRRSLKAYRMRQDDLRTVRNKFGTFPFSDLADLDIYERLC